MKDGSGRGCELTGSTAEDAETMKRNENEKMGKKLTPIFALIPFLFGWLPDLLGLVQVMLFIVEGEGVYGSF